MENYFFKFGRDDWRPIMADSHWHAAVQAAELYDEEEGNFPIIGGMKIQVCIRRENSESVLYELNGEAVPTYYAEEVP